MAQEKPIKAFLLTPTKRQRFKVLHFDTLPRLFLHIANIFLVFFPPSQ